MTFDLEYATQHYAEITKEYEEKIEKLTMLDIAICHYEEVAEELEKKVKPYQCESINKKLYEVNKKEWDSYLERASEYRQLAEWLKELKDYKRLGTYSRVYKCGECIYKDPGYNCADCIWHYYDNFKPKEVNANDDT